MKKYRIVYEVNGAIFTMEMKATNQFNAITNFYKVKRLPVNALLAAILEK